MSHQLNIFSGYSRSTPSLFASIVIPLYEICVSMELVAIGGGLRYTKNTTGGILTWLSGKVAMVKAVIKAIKAAGVGLNGSSDCSCCHKLNRKGEKEQERMVKT